GAVGLFRPLTVGVSDSVDLRTTGLVALVFSTTLLFNLLNEWLWFGRRPAGATLVAAVLGIIGLVLIFLPEFGKPQDEHILLGILLVLAAAFCASLGNVLGGKLLGEGTSVIAMNAYAMATGATACLAWAAVNNDWEGLILTRSYLGALMYLSLIGSVVAWGLYFVLMRDIGPSRGAYAAVAVPAIALVISTFMEGYTWSIEAVLGLALVLFGNVLILRVREEKSSRARQMLDSDSQEGSSA
ncbi:MAG: DMT family transporter, partial [Gammaproteobacteria bacterium]|nr:DMT family transporter [Gammaproteobacteria bacterium]